MSRTIRWSATLLVLAGLTAGTAQAWPLAEARPTLAVADIGSRLSAAWDRLVSRFLPVAPKPAGQTPSGAQVKGSCSVDPSGNCV
jgi:hypothetical protein